MFSALFGLEDHTGTYRETRDAYLRAVDELNLATGPYKQARDAYLDATRSHTESLFEPRAVVMGELTNS